MGYYLNLLKIRVWLKRQDAAARPLQVAELSILDKRWRGAGKSLFLPTDTGMT